MRIFSRMFGILILFIIMSVYINKTDLAFCQEQHELSGSGGGTWAYKAIITVREQVGLKRLNEPIELTINSDKIKSLGEDIRIVDANYNEVPCQVKVSNPDTYKVYYFAQADPNAANTYYLYFGNPHAIKPNYEVTNCSLNNQTKTWQTDTVLVEWGGKAGFYPGTFGTNPITTLMFDNNSDKNLTNDLDCLTDEYAWDQVYGYLGSTLIGDKPGDFGSNQAQIIETGPIFCEVALGNARIRCYKGQKWIQANQYVDSMWCFSRNYQFMKHGLGDEIFIPDWGPGDIHVWLTGYSSSSINPEYMAFRNPSNGLVFGAIAQDVAVWQIYAKYSGGWDRTISFNDSSNKPDAKIYWYSDTSNSYEGIERFAKQVLNPLEVEVRVDTEPPITSIAKLPESPDGLDGWYVTQPQVTLTASEDATTYYCMDGGAKLTYSSPIVIPEGEHRLTYYSVDVSGNTEDEKHVDFKVDRGRPELATSLSPQRAGNHYLINEPIVFSCDATDSISGVATVSAAVNGAPVLFGPQLIFNKLGEYTLNATAIDSAGNEVSTAQSFTVGYGFKWLRPVRRDGDSEGQPYVTGATTTIPIRFSAADLFGKFVTDKTVKVVLSDGANAATFAYGRSGQVVRINACDGKYLLDVNPRSYPWLQAGGTYTISVYFGGSYQNLGIPHGKIKLELI